MSSDASSSSDAASAGRPAGVATAAPPPPPPAAAGKATASEDARGVSQRRNHYWTCRIKADHVSTELLVVGLIQRIEGCYVLVIVEASNPAVDWHKERGDGREGGDVGNKLQREGPGCWSLCGCWRGKFRRVEFLDRFLDKVGIVTGEFEGAKALACAKIFQHVQKNTLSNSNLLSDSDSE